MRHTLLLTATLALCSGNTAHAHDLQLDITGSATQSSQSNPRSGAVSVGLAASWTATEILELDASFAWLRDLPHNDLFVLSGGASLLLGEHVVTYLGITGSPPATSKSQTTIGPAEVTLSATTSSYGALASASYFTSGNSRFESAFDASVTANRFLSSQALAGRGCVLNPSLPRCAPRDSALIQAKLTAGYTATLSDDTDLSLEVSGYLYDQDPWEAGTFSIYALGRQFDAGNGFPVAPYAVSVRPRVAHRFGRSLTGKLWYQFAAYAGGRGQNHLLGTRWQHRFSSGWAPFVGLSAQRDVDASGGVFTFTGTAGVRFDF